MQSTQIEMVKLVNDMTETWKLRLYSNMVMEMETKRTTPRFNKWDSGNHQWAVPDYNSSCSHLVIKCNWWLQPYIGIRSDKM